MLKAWIKYITALAYLPFCGKGRRVVLCYHSLKSDFTAGFRKQMEYIVCHCQVVKPSEILTVESDGRTIVAVTFDDAYVSFYENAVSVLTELNMPAGVFVPTGFIGRQCNWQMPEGHPDKNEKVIDRQQILGLEKHGIEVFSHTVSHPNLTKLSDEELKRELIDSRIELEDVLGHPVDIISYPHGIYDRRVIDFAAAGGYRLGFTIEPRWVNDLENKLTLGRLVVSPKESLSIFKLKAAGAYAAENVLRNLKRRIR